MSGGEFRHSEAPDYAGAAAAIRRGDDLKPKQSTASIIVEELEKREARAKEDVVRAIDQGIHELQEARDRITDGYGVNDRGILQQTGRDIDTYAAIWMVLASQRHLAARIEENHS